MSQTPVHAEDEAVNQTLPGYSRWHLGEGEEGKIRMLQVIGEHRGDITVN